MSWDSPRRYTLYPFYHDNPFYHNTSHPHLPELPGHDKSQNTYHGTVTLTPFLLRNPNSPTSRTRPDFLRECAAGGLDGCVVAYRTFESAEATGRVDAELLAALPASLRFICHNGAGYDQLDIPACTARGVRVSNVRSAVDDATADTAIFLLLGALRNFSPGLQNLRRGAWRGEGDQGPGAVPAQGHDPQGKVLGILGMGGIGQNVARKARAFGMRIRYHNRTRLSRELEEACGAEYADFEGLLKESDVLSLNLPLTVSASPPPLVFPNYSWCKRRRNR